MWWEALPSGLITAGALMVPCYTYILLNQIFLGTNYRRRLFTNFEAHTHLRDGRLSGKRDAYVQKGLETIDFDLCPVKEKPCVC